MDLLCTENIMNDYESEPLCQQHHHHHQMQLQQQHQQQQQRRTQQTTATIYTTYDDDDDEESAQQMKLATTATSALSLTTTTIATSNCCSSASSTTSDCSAISNNSTGTSCSTYCRQNYNYNSSVGVGASGCAGDVCSNNSNSAVTAATAAAKIVTAVATCIVAADNTTGTVPATTANGSVEPQRITVYAEQMPKEQHPQQRNNNHSYQQQQQQQQQHNVYTTNLINRTLDYVNTATEDPTFLTDRCLENALKAEEKRPQIICTYFKTVQTDITPPMRKIVAEWMMEVCAEEKCQEEVVLLALNYMDRFLSTKSVRKTQLQILAAACLLLASKLREPSCRALSADLLVFYTDNSIYKSDLIKWELYVLSRLGWDLSSVTPLDFLELLLIRLPIRTNKCPDLNMDKVRQHAQAFISLAAKEHHFSIYSASTIAASSIAAALSGLKWHMRTGQNLRYLLNLLTDLTSVEQDYLHDCMMKMESIFEEHSRNLQPYLVSVEQQQIETGQLSAQQQQQLLHASVTAAAAAAAAAAATCGGGNAHNTQLLLLPDLTQTCKMQANAQKDVQDIKY